MSEHDYIGCIHDGNKGFPCGDSKCDSCDNGFDYGLFMACDNCGDGGSNDYGYPTWQMQDCGLIYCWSCADKLASIERGEE